MELLGLRYSTQHYDEYLSGFDNVDMFQIFHSDSFFPRIQNDDPTYDADRPNPVFLIAQKILTTFELGLESGFDVLPYNLQFWLIPHVSLWYLMSPNFPIPLPLGDRFDRLQITPTQHVDRSGVLYLLGVGEEAESLLFSAKLLEMMETLQSILVTSRSSFLMSLNSYSIGKIDGYALARGEVNAISPRDFLGTTPQIRKAFWIMHSYLLQF